LAIRQLVKDSRTRIVLSCHSTANQHLEEASTHKSTSLTHAGNVFFVSCVLEL